MPLAASRASSTTTENVMLTESTEAIRTMKPIQVGLLGIGTVGSGTFNVLRRNQEEIRRRAGRGIEITRIAVRTPSKVQGAEGIDVTTDFNAVVDDPSIDI